jgi:uncharacterized protein (TIGR02231 family)
VLKFKPDINAIVLYLDGVEYNHKVPVKLVSGRNLLVFEGLSAKLDPTSIRASVPDGVSVLSITSKIDYLTKNEEKPRIHTLRDSVTLIAAKIQAYQDEWDALSAEREVLTKNQSIGGVQTGVNVTELQKAADYYFARVLEINKRVSQIEVQNADAQLTLVNLNNELNELNAKLGYQRAQISVLLSTDIDRSTDLDLSYYVNDAGWAPYYELRSDDIGQPVELIYRARVYNNTDIDWNNVDLVLSTGDPTKSVTQPKLDPWKLNYEYDVDDYVSTIQVSSNMNKKGKMDKDGEKAYEMYDTVVSGTVQYTTIEVSQLSVEFPIKVKYSIPSDSKPYIVDVTEYTLPATYKHICIPKEDNDAFLLARIAGWEDLNLIEGPANVYFSGSYVGQSYLYTRNVADTLDLSLGRDSKVLVTRTKMKEFTDKQLIGTKRKETYRYQIVVKNNRKSAIQIEIQDQVPVSENDEIEVNVDETSKADYNVLSGLCKWNFTIQPDKSETVNIQYTVKYPKNKVVQTRNEKMRDVYCPSF